MQIVQYTEKDFELWDKFVNEISVNGNFLHSRNFLNYHPKGRFEDHSLIFKDGNKILAVCPGVLEIKEGKKSFVSHPGSTYGGIIINKKQHALKKQFELVNELMLYLKSEKFNEVIIKQTSPILCRCSLDGFEYVFWKLKFKEYKEINFFVDMENYRLPITSNFSQGKRTNINNCLKNGLEFKDLSEDNLADFYQILCQTLEKYGTQPVHSFKEILLLRERLKKNIIFKGAYQGENLLGGAMLFVFPARKGVCIHTQYLAADPSFARLSPMSFLYYGVLDYAMQNKIRYVSWGIATENRGLILNSGLADSKDSFGSEHSINKTFVKEIGIE